MPGVQRLEEGRRLRGADFADDDPIRPQPHRGRDQPRHADAGMSVSRPRSGRRLEHRHAGMVGCDVFRGVLDHDDAIGGRDESGEGAQERRLSAPGAPENAMFSCASTASRMRAATRWKDAPIRAMLEA